MEALNNAFYRIEIDHTERVVKAWRSAIPFESTQHVEAGLLEVFRSLESIDRPRYCLYLDSRAAPRRNDPATEALFIRLRPKLLDGYRAVIILMRTALGVFQAQRHVRDDGSVSVICHNEEEALEYLRLYTQ